MKRSHGQKPGWADCVLLWCLAGLGAAAVCRAAPPLPAPPARNDVAAVLAAGGEAKEPPRKLRLLLLADKKDHKEHEHDYPAWQERWALLLGGRAASAATQVNLFGLGSTTEQTLTGAENVEVVCANGWPTDAQWASAQVVVAFCYLTWTDDHKRQLQHYLDHGGGLVLIHSATWTKPKADAEVAALVGVGGFTRFRHGAVQLEITAAGHPICQGLPRQLSFLDETYWPPTPPLDTPRVTVLAVSQENESPTDGNRRPQPMFWICSSGRGRVFGCVLGHYTWTFDDPWFRLLVLRGIAWSAGETATRFDALTLRGARVMEN
ncbi:MAG: ThuA domain-containing protein [Kiritimatiellaeota bacterium]|nr:ThuA domain-containing protein [Kiritimatiellota bacterium]